MVPRLRRSGRRLGEGGKRPGASSIFAARGARQPPLPDPLLAPGHCNPGQGGRGEPPPSQPRLERKDTSPNFFVVGGGGVPLSARNKSKILNPSAGGGRGETTMIPKITGSALRSGGGGCSAPGQCPYARASVPTVFPGSSAIIHMPELLGTQRRRRGSGGGGCRCGGASPPSPLPAPAAGVPGGDGQGEVTGGSEGESDRQTEAAGRERRGSRAGSCDLPIPPYGGGEGEPGGWRQAGGGGRRPERRKEAGGCWLRWRPSGRGLEDSPPSSCWRTGPTYRTQACLPSVLAFRGRLPLQVEVPP